MSRKRELYMEVTLAGRTFSFPDEILTLTANDPKIEDSYFAIKKVVFKEKESDDVFTFTFKDIKKTLRSPKTSAQKTATANAIRAKLKFDGDNKYTDNKKIIAAFVDDKGVAKDSFKAEDTITITALRKEERTYYLKNSFGSMGNQMYLIVETKKLNAKKVKIKIHESESKIKKVKGEKEVEGEKKKKLKLLKSTEDVLPVKVFAKKEDKTTDTEATDWIEIEIETVKAEDAGSGFYISEDNTTDKEVGIKKIQLRPKEDKDFKEWAEKLYIREDETEAGKKKIQEEEQKVKDRAKEKTTHLTFDKDADKKSFPIKITWLKSIEVGKEAVYTFTKYKAGATDADKNNIRWSLYVQGETKPAKGKRDSLYIDSKSKPNLYTYAKTELVDGKNKLTIVFDKALIGKKVQIEPFRGEPDLSTKKDYVSTTFIKEKPTPKIAELDTAKLWLQTQCNDCEEEEQEKEFLKKDEFMLKTANHTYNKKYDIMSNEVYINIITPRKRDREGPLVVIDEYGSILFKSHSLCRGSISNRTKAGGNGDTPMGRTTTTYNSDAHKGNKSFGNHGLIYLTGDSGEFLTATNNGRSGIAIHSGHTVGYSSQINDNGQLMSTHGCVRIYNSDMKKLGNLYDKLKKENKNIYCYIEDYSGDIKDVYSYYGMDIDTKDTAQKARNINQ